MKREILVAVSLGLSGCMADPGRTVSASDLPPIQRDYRQPIMAWARTFYVEPRFVRDARISDPVPARDSNGRLVWLVCVQADAGERAGPYRMAPQAFGFAPDYVSTPLSRKGSSLNREDCGRQPLSWRPFPQLTSSR